MSVAGTAVPVTMASPQGFWQRRVLQPVRAQLTLGITPDRIAATLGVGTACSLFPFLGATTLLNLAVGVALRMNQPILQTLNQLLGPLQLALILVYVRVGEALWQSESQQLTIPGMLRTFRDSSVSEFLQQFGWAGVHAFSAWAISAPLIVTLVYFSFRPLLRRAAQRTLPA